MTQSVTDTLKKFFIRYSIASVLAIIIVALCLIDSTMVSVRSLRNIISDAAPILLMSSGMALCLFSGYVDLSAGAVAAFSGILAGSFVQRADIAGRIFSLIPAIPAFIVIPVIISVFYAIGMLYGLFISKSKVPSWFFTLALSSVLMGLGYVYVSIPESDILQVSGFTNQFLQFGVGYVGSGPTYSLPFTILTTIIVLILLWTTMRYNKIEFKIQHSALEKRNTTRNLKTMFACSTALFSLAGIMITARNGIATPTIGFGLTSDALAICLIASFSLSGGKGNLKAVIISTFIYTTLLYCITFIGVNQYVSLIIRGIILIAAVSLELHIKNAEKEKVDTQ